MESQKRKIKVLVLGAGGNVSQGIIKALKNSQLDIELIGACISSESTGLYMCDKAYISPYANDEVFLDWLIELCNREKVDIVLTGVEENICAIEEQIQKFRECTNSVFIASDYNKLMVGQDKFQTCEWLKANGCNYPRYCRLENDKEVEKLIDEVGFPLIAKPCVGKSSMGVYLLNSLEDLAEIRGKEAYVLEECVGNSEQEYTVGCYCNRNGILQDIIIMRRKVKNGSTVWAEVVEHEKIYQEAVKICKAFLPKGPLNVQMRLNGNGEPVCFELNVRFSGTTPMRAHFGYRDVEAMIREYVLGEAIDTCFQIKKGEVFRYENEMYIECGASHVLHEKGYDLNMKGKNRYMEDMKVRRE